MITTDLALNTWLASARGALRFDCWSFSLSPSKTVLRWTDADFDITLPGSPARVFSRLPIIKRSTLRRSLGLSVDELNVDLSFDAGATVLGVDALLFARRGGFDGAEIQLERAYYDVDGTYKGKMVQFFGRAGVAEMSPPTVKLSVKSELYRLNIMMPRETYQPACLNQIYDVNCGLNPATWSVSGTVTGVNGTTTWLQSALGQAAAYFDKGVLTFTSGANSGQSRTVKAFAGGVFQFSLGFWEPISVGHTFTVRPGCDQTLSTCTSKFNNRLRYRGHPFVPSPETAMAS